MIDLIVDIVFALLAVLSAVWGAFVLKKLIALNRRYKRAIVLIPLYKRSKWPIFALSLLGLCLVGDIVYMIVKPGDWILTLSVLVIIGMLASVLVVMILTKCAVLDSGAIVPFRFIEWARFYDYRIEGTTIFFIGDDRGFDTMGAATCKLDFDEANLDKLKFILEKYKNR